MTRVAEALYRHESSFLTLQQTATDKRFDVPYQKTFHFEGGYIDAAHGVLSQRKHASGMIDYGVEGWLLPADAEKLYEMAYFCQGPILELGTYRGLSSAVMASAIDAAKSNSHVVSVDLDPSSVSIATGNLDGRPGAERVHFFTVDGEKAIRDQAAEKSAYGFAFIDHSHEYEHVYVACRILHRVITIGGFALFHDFNDPRNAARDAVDYGVYQGVMDGLDIRHWEFWGMYGCTGLFRRIGAW